MKRYKSYSDIFAIWLKNRVALGLIKFTHKDISKVTGANCSYGVLRDLKLKFNFNFKESKAISVKKYFDDKGKEFIVTKHYKVYEVITNDC